MSLDKLVITIDGDSSGLTKALTSAGNRLDTFNQRVTNSSRSLTRLMGQMSGFGSSISGITASLNNVSAALQNAANRMNNYTASIQNVQRSTRNMGSGLGNTKRQVESLSDSFGKAILTIYSIRALLFTGQELFGGVLHQVIDVNAQYERTNTLLKGMSGGITDAQQAAVAHRDQTYIWDLATKAPFSVQQITDAFVRLTAVGLKPASGQLKAMLDATAHFGGSSTTQNLQHVQLAIAEMMEGGTVQARQLRMLSQTGGIATATQDMANAYARSQGKVLAEGQNASIPALRDAMKKGLVEAGKVIPELMKVWEEEYKDSGEKMMGLWGGLMAQMTTAWQKMIVRITKEDGDNSLFAFVKAQVTELITFLNSQQGDAFLKELEAGFVETGHMIVSLVTTIYKYRDTIVLAAKAATIFYGAVLAWRAFSSVIGILSGIVNTVSAIGKIANASQAVLFLFGKSAVEAARSLGILTAAGEFALVPFIASLGTLGLIIGAMYGLKKAYDIHSESLVNHSKYTQEDMKALQDTATWVEQTQKQIETTTVKNKEEKKSWDDKTNAILNTGKALIAVQRIDVAKKVGDQYDAKVEQNKVTNNSGLKIPFTDYRLDPLGYFGLSPDENKAKDKYDQATKDAGVSLARLRLLEQYSKNLSDIQAKGGPKIVTPETDDGKTGKDHLGGTDDKRSSLVSALNKNAELEARLQDLKDTQAAVKLNPNAEDVTTAQDKYANDADAIALKNKEIANGFKSQTALNAATEKAKSDNDVATLSIKKATAALREQRDDAGKLTAFNTEVENQQAKAREELGKLDDAYTNVDDKVKQYTDSLERQYRKQLDSTDADTRATAQADLAAAALAKRAELVNAEAATDNDSTKTIMQGLMTEDEKREDNYHKEMLRLNSMIAAAQQLEGPDREKTLAAFYAYKDALQKKNKIDKNPFAGWAEDAKDAKTKIGSALTGSLDGFVDQLATGKMAFKQFAVSLLEDITKIILKAVIARAILAALGLGGPNLSSAPLNIASDTMTVAPIDFGSVAPVPGMHTGGLVGRNATFHRSVDPSMFAFAKRYHTGGFPGLQDGEVPIIAKKGEGVFTPEQMKALGNNGSQSGSGGAAPQINVINQTSAPVGQGDTKMQFDGEKYIVNVVLKHAQKPGPMRDLLKGTPTN